jgi:actin-related protein 6
LQQAGLVETVAQVIESMPEDIQGMLWANIGLFGGLASTDGFGERLSVVPPPSSSSST